MKKPSLVLIFILLLASYLDAQSFYNRKRNRKFIVSAGTGTSSYFGELSNDGDFLDTKLNLDFGLQYRITNNLLVGASLIFFQLQGNDAEADDDTRVRRNLSFRSNNTELNIGGRYNLFPEGERFYQRKPINFYLFAGLGLTWYSPTAELDGKRYTLRSLETEGVKYAPFTVVLPFGPGVKFMISPYFNIVLEGGYRLTFTDYLDDVSTVHVDQSTFTDPIAAALSDRRPEIGLDVKSAGAKRGSPEQNDGYFILNAKVEYFVPAGILFSGKNKVKKRRTKRRRY